MLNTPIKTSVKTYFIKTYGCQANIADSQKLSGILEVLGYEELVLPKVYEKKTEKEQFEYILKHADLFVINSCAVRQKSEDKIYGLGKTVKQVEVKKQRKAKIVLAGCVVGSVHGKRARYSEKELLKKTSWADFYVNPWEIGQLPVILGLERKINTVNPKQDPQDHTHAYINISYGCDNFCSYCVVPYSRGPEISRSEKDILSEVNSLVSRGVRSITLCGQNVNSWGLSQREKMKIRTGSNQKLPFVKLLKKIHSIPSIEKIDFISSNPFDFTNDLVEALKLPKVGNYLHIAVQSGNNEILKAMNRRHTVEEFMDLVKRIKKVRPNIELGTDVIVGFPGETNKQFLDTVKMIKKLNFRAVYMSMYSPRKGTYAERYIKDDVPMREKKRRLGYLNRTYRKMKSWDE